jgi:hypothetical protein
MYHTYIKRILKVEVTGDTPEEVLAELKKKQTQEILISDTFLVEDDNELIVAKQKVIYDGVGKVLREERLLR